MSDTVEIERKFMVADLDVLKGLDGELFKQGYLAATPDRTVRVRRVGDAGWLTIKSAAIGFTRREYEYTIPAEHAEEMLNDLCVGTVISKVRHKVFHEGATWEIDRFISPHEGLVIAEIELECESDDIALPPWLGIEVTHDHRFSNSHLSSHPGQTPLPLDSTGGQDQTLCTPPTTHRDQI